MKQAYDQVAEGWGPDPGGDGLAVFAIVYSPFGNGLRAQGWALVVHEPVASTDISFPLESGGCRGREARTSFKGASQSELRF